MPPPIAGPRTGGAFRARGRCLTSAELKEAIDCVEDSMPLGNRCATSCIADYPNANKCYRKAKWLAHLFAAVLYTAFTR